MEATIMGYKRDYRVLGNRVQGLRGSGLRELGLEFRDLGLGFRV